MGKRRAYILDDSETARAQLRQQLRDFDFEVLVLGERSFDETLRRSSADADLVLVGLAEPGEDFRGYYERLHERFEGLPTTLFVLAAEDLAFGEVLVER